jgi:uncharacterized protein YbcV (DUF1398 family)
MKAMNAETIAECMTASFANTPFPAVVHKLAEAGVTAYTADLIALRKTYYGAGAESLDKALPLADSPAIAPDFDSAAVEATVKAIQRKEIGYTEFLRKIMAAGCARYSVFFGGRKAMYFGRDGAVYTEPFPAAK